MPWIPSTKTPFMLALIYQHHGSVMGMGIPPCPAPPVQTRGWLIQKLGATDLLMMKSDVPRVYCIRSLFGTAGDKVQSLAQSKRFHVTASPSSGDRVSHCEKRSTHTHCIHTLYTHTLYTRCTHTVCVRCHRMSQVHRSLRFNICSSEL